MDVLAFTNYIKSLGLSLSNQSKIIDKYIEIQRNNEINKKIIKSVTLDQYVNQIITMFNNNSNLSSSVFANYIKFAIEKIINSPDLITEIVKKD